MPIARYQLPDGRIARYEVPAEFSASDEAALRKQTDPDLVGVLKGIGNQIGDYVYGAGQITGQQPAADARPRGRETASEQFGRLVLPLAAGFALPAEGLAGPAIGGLIGGGLAALQPITDPAHQSRGVRTALGVGLGVAGPVAGARIGRAVAPEVSQLSQERGALIDPAEQAGFQLTPGMRTGDAGLLSKEADLAKTTFGAPRFNEINRANTDAIGRNLAAAMEQKGVSEITPKVLQQAETDNNALFKQAVHGKNVNLDGTFVQNSQQLLGNNPRATQLLHELNPQAAIAIENGQPITGEMYDTLRKQLGGLANRASESNVNQYPLENTFRQLQNELDAAADRTAALPVQGGPINNPLRPEDLSTLQRARDQWRAIQVAEASTKGSFSVDPAKFNAAVQKYYRSGEPLHDLNSQVQNIPGLSRSVEAGNPANMRQNAPAKTSFFERMGGYGSSFAIPAGLAYSATNSPEVAGAVGMTSALARGLLGGRGYIAPAYLNYGGAYYTPSGGRQILAEILRRSAQSIPTTEQNIKLNQR